MRPRHRSYDVPGSGARSSELRRETSTVRTSDPESQQVVSAPDEISLIVAQDMPMRKSPQVGIVNSTLDWIK